VDLRRPPVVPWKEVLRLASAPNVEGYYIEDESEDARRQILRSLKFLEALNN
jgi:hypothetical protein